MKTFSRREFLALGSLTVGGALVGARALSQPASPARFPALIPIQTTLIEPGLRAASLTARPGATTVGGLSAKLLTYGGSLLRVRAGDTLRLRFANGLTEPTNLHWHGLHVSPKADDPFRVVAPGETVSVDYAVPKDASGLTWFHPHHHGMVAEQQFAGLSGAIVIESDLDELFSEAEEHVLLLRDLELDGGRPAPHTMADWMNGKEGSLLLVNGSIRPSLRAQKPWLRLRIVNAANARYYRLRLENHALGLIGTDGGYLERPVELEELLLAPGERADVIVRLEREGSYRLQALPYDRGAMMMMSGSGSGNMGGMSDSGGMGGMGGQNQSAGTTTMGLGQSRLETLLSVAVPSGFKPRALPSSIATLPALDATKADVRRSITFTEQMMKARFFLNGRAFDPDRVDFTGKLNTLETWEIVNKSDMDHPFHLHVYPFQVLSRNGQPAPYRAWKDVVNLKKNDTVQLAVPLSDFTGKTVYHCHVLEHEDRGMMGVLEVKGEG